MLDRNRHAGDPQIEAEAQLVIGKNLPAGFAAGRKRLPPEQARSFAEMYLGALTVSCPGEGYERIGQIFEERVFLKLDVGGVFGGARSRAATVNARSAGRGDLRGRAAADSYIELQFVARQYATGKIVQMHQCPAAWQLECPHHFKRLALFEHLKTRPRGLRVVFEPQRETAVSFRHFVN
jgi:hypothetical protein